MPDLPTQAAARVKGEELHVTKAFTELHSHALFSDRLPNYV